MDWLTENGISPSQWNLDPEEVSRIISAGVALKISFCPVFIYDLSEHQRGRGKIIFFDSTLLEKPLISQDEAVAAILHEIGHTVNRFKSKHQAGPEFFMEHMKRKDNPCADEFDADDYARHCGYGEHLANGLQKIIDSGQPGFNTPVNHNRIKRIRDNEEKQRHF